MIKVPIYLGGMRHRAARADRCQWAKEQFGSDFTWEWKLLSDGKIEKYWMIGHFNNAEDATAFKLKFGV
jgi:hypothetical protein